jgi:membrane fusion protein, copper/silver efflux system
MKPNTNIRIFILLFTAILASAGLSITGCSKNERTQGEQLYTCGMHPQVIQNKPGNCPICGMKLTPIRKQGGGTSSNSHVANATNANMSSNSEEAGIITIDPATSQNMGLRTGLVTLGPLRRTIRTVGIIDYDETALAEVSTKFRGWIEKLYVDATGKQMHRGEPLFEIYSPELYLAQTEYLLSLGSMTNHENTAAELRRTASLTKLKYWDISDDQIADLERTRAAKKTLRVNAPRDGIVVEKMVVEGQMVEAGARLYRLADLATVWVQAQVYEQDLPFVRLGQEAVVSLASQPDPKFRGRVTYLYPMVDDKTRTAKVRMEFHNPGYFLKPGMYATVELVAELAPSALLVPDMAVLRSGEKNTVFVALDRGRFEARTVILGPRAGEDSYAVLSGLNEGERVVTSGQFMLDSESQLREAIQKMMKPGETGPQMTGATNGHRTMTNAMPAMPENVVYICPMPEHVALQYQHPGKCPLCGMTLVPVTPETLAKIQPGGHIEYYTCPMPEHNDVHSDKPGKCPKCNMTLIPVMKQASSVRTNLAPETSKILPEKLYTCPMDSHADVVSDKPGKCPKCGMDLVETVKVKHGKIAEENWRRHGAR